MSSSKAQALKGKAGKPAGASLSPASESELGFKRKDMVDWFDPRQLAKTGVKVLLSAILGAYADKREMQAALHPLDEEDHLIYDHSAEREIWIDFIADVGDGWDSTYTMAWLLAQKSLKPEGCNSDIPRGRILVLGGDEVYPTAKREEYQDRFVGPYQSALPRIDGAAPPHLFAIPGNHDWYDGLTSFLRLFCQERKIGEWCTQQDKSYFAIKLPHKWWLWGIDIQFAADVDKPQIEYFERIAQEKVKEGDKIILVNASPSWADGEKTTPSPYQNLEFFVRETVLKHKGEVPVMLTGDLHHYCRYEANGGGRQYITAGGGGAYLYATHRMPETIELKEGDGKVTCKRAGEFPSMKDSRRLRYGILLFPFKSWKFSSLLAFLYMLYAWLLQSATKSDDLTFMDKIKDYSLSDAASVLYEFFEVLKHSPASVLFLAVLVFGLKAFSDAKSEIGKWGTGVVHASAHVALNIALIWGFAHLNLTNEWVTKTFGIEGSWQMRQASLFSAEMFVLGGILGGFLMGLYLLLSELAGRHTNEVFSAQRIPDYKNFLRMRIDESGTLTIFPIGVKQVCKKWKYRPGAADGQPLLAPEDGSNIEAHLIEKPIVLKPGN